MLFTAATPAEDYKTISTDLSVFKIQNAWVFSATSFHYVVPQIFPHDRPPSRSSTLSLNRRWSQSVAYRGGFKTPSKFRRPTEIVPNSTRLWKLLKISEFRTPTPQDFRKKGSKIPELPPVRNCVTLLTYLLHGAGSFLSSWLACS